jgi:hypothetical protein
MLVKFVYAHSFHAHSFHALKEMNYEWVKVSRSVVAPDPTEHASQTAQGRRSDASQRTLYRVIAVRRTESAI